MASPFMDGYAQILDNTGAPISGAKLNFYQSGTATRKDTFSDEAGLLLVQSVSSHCLPPWLPGVGVTVTPVVSERRAGRGWGASSEECRSGNSRFLSIKRLSPPRNRVPVYWVLSQYPLGTTDTSTGRPAWPLPCALGG